MTRDNENLAWLPAAGYSGVRNLLASTSSPRSVAKKVPDSAMSSRLAQSSVPRPGSPSFPELLDGSSGSRGTGEDSPHGNVRRAGAPAPHRLNIQVLHVQRGVFDALSARCRV